MSKTKQEGTRIRVGGAYQGKIVVEVDVHGDPYGHDMCDSADCHWEPNASDTIYYTEQEAKQLITDLQSALRQLRTTKTPKEHRHVYRRPSRKS